MSSAAFRRRRGGRFYAARVHPVTRRSRRHAYVRPGRETLSPRATSQRNRLAVARIADYVHEP